MGQDQLIEGFLRDFLKPIIREAISEGIKTATAPAPPSELVQLEAIRRKECLSGKEVEQLYSLKSNTLKAWRAQGRGPSYIRDGDLILYRRTDVEAWLKSNHVRTYDQKGDV